MKEYIIMISLILSGFSFLIGTMSAVDQNNHMTGEPYKAIWDCRPNSILSMVNIPLRAGCELTKQRGWNEK